MVNKGRVVSVSRTHELQWHETPDKDAIGLLSQAHPENPFYTHEYVAFRLAQGWTPHMLWLDAGYDATGATAVGCTAFGKSGRASRTLEIPSMPDVDADHVFWQELRTLCRKERITDLTVGSFASPGGTIPDLGPVVSRKDRWEYVLDLQQPDLFRKMRKGHAYSIKRGQKAGLVLKRRTDMEACRIHADLINASMERRQQRGENVSTGAQADNFASILDAGAGEIFQAVQDDNVLSSNLILLSDKGGYNHTQGTRPDGMNVGAAQFLIHAIAQSLAADGATLFNIGGTDDPESGLTKFKSGFGKSTRVISLQSAQFTMHRSFLGTVKSVLRSVHSR